MGSLVVYGHSASFVRRASRAQGTVTALARRQSTDYSNPNGSTTGMPSVSYSYLPVVRFQHGTQQIQFNGSVATNPPAFHVGETVTVLYLDSDPYGAKIESFTSLWALPMIFGAIGAIFLAIGTRMIFGSRPSAAHERAG